MAIERTLSIIKPNATRRNLTGQINARLEDAGQLSDAGEKVGEKVWRMPLGEAYDKMLKSDIADIKNISGGRGAFEPATFRL